jgi:hypothetical protein
MIQRIQTVWLFLAALVMACIFYFPVYQFKGTPAQLPMTIGNDFVGIILAGISIILSLVTIFRFKNRKNQSGLTWLNILVTIGLQAWLFFKITNFRSDPANSTLQGYYWIGTFLPLVTIILLFMAKSGIRKDEKLVKSLDRLRD